MEKKKDPIWFWVINGLIAVLLLFFIFQNLATTNIEFLWMSTSGPRFLIYLILFFLGVFVGWLWTFFHQLKKERRQKREVREEQKKDAAS